MESVTSRHTTAFLAQISELPFCSFTQKFHLSNQISNLQHFGKCFHIGYSGRSVLRPIYRKWNVFNECWQLHWNFPLKTFDFRHSAAAHCYLSHGTLVCREIGNSWEALRYKIGHVNTIQRESVEFKWQVIPETRCCDGHGSIGEHGMRSEQGSRKTETGRWPDRDGLLDS